MVDVTVPFGDVIHEIRPRRHVHREMVVVYLLPGAKAEVQRRQQG